MRTLVPYVVLTVGAAAAALIDPLVFSIYIIGVPIVLLMLFLFKKFGKNFLAWTMSRTFRKADKSIERIQSNLPVSSGPKVNMSIGTTGIEEIKLALPTGHPKKPRIDVDPRDIAIEAIGYGQTKLMHEIFTSNRSDEQVQQALDLIENSRRSQLADMLPSEEDSDSNYFVPGTGNPYSLSNDDDKYSVE